MKILKLKIDPRQTVQVYEWLIVVVLLAVADPTVASIWMGLLVGISGLFFRVWSRGYPREDFERSILGPYRFVRHPHYLGTFLFLFGMCVSSRSAYITFAMLLGCILLFRLVREEEMALARSRAGTFFKDYTLRVPSFVPSIFPYSESGEEGLRFSFAYALLKSQRSELNAIALMIIFYLFMFLLTRLSEPIFARLVISAIIFVAGSMVLFLQWKRKVSI